MSRRTTLTEEQQAKRAGRITGTRAAMIMGESPFGGELEAHREIHGHEDFKGSDVTDIGTIIEPSILQMHAHFNGVTVVPGRTQIHPELDWLCASTDGYQVLADGTEEQIVECKNLSSYTSPLWGDPEREEIPADRVIQGIVQLACHPHIEVVNFAVLMEGAEFRNYPLRRNQDDITNVLTVLHDWYRKHVLGDIVPEPWHGMYPATVWPVALPTIRQANGEPATVAVCEKLRENRIAGANLEIERRRLEQQTKILIGEGKGIELIVADKKAKLTWTRGPGSLRGDVKLFTELCRSLGATQGQIDACYTRTKDADRLYIPRDWTKPTIELNRDEQEAEDGESNAA